MTTVLWSMGASPWFRKRMLGTCAVTGALGLAGCLGGAEGAVRVESLEGASPLAVLEESSERWRSAQREADAASLALARLGPDEADARELDALRGTLGRLREREAAEREALDPVIDELVASASVEDEARLARVVDAVFLDEWHRAVGSTALHWAQWSAPVLLRHAPSCGDVAADHLIEDVLHALAEDDRVGYVSALDALDRAVECGSLAEAIVVQSALVEALDRVREHFGERLERLARRTTFSQLLNVILLIHDRTKWIGETALMTWMRAHRGELGEVLLEHSSVPHLAGLWLHHPETGELVQLANLCENRPVRGCVSATHLLDALTDPMRLGMGTCSAVAMITQDLLKGGGYYCAQGLCERESHAEGIAGILAAGVTQYGVSVEALAERRCRDGGGGGGGGMGSGGLVPDQVSCVVSVGRDAPREQLACMVGILSAATRVTVPGDEGGAPGPSSCGSEAAGMQPLPPRPDPSTPPPPPDPPPPPPPPPPTPSIPPCHRAPCVSCPNCDRPRDDAGCTPGGALMTAMMACSSTDEVPSATACDPTYCDSVEPSSDAIDLGHCFGPEATGSTVGSLACASISCGPGFTSGLSGGRCRCISEEGLGPIHLDVCATARCEDGSAPIATSGGCSCSSSGDGGFGEPKDWGTTEGGLYGPPFPRP